MKHSRTLALVAVMLLVACGDDSTGPPPDDGGNNNPTPQATAPGTPNGVATTATIGPAGGTLASDDGSFAIDIPAGALSSDTDITIQPITNTAWGGVGNGYQLEPDGLTFAVPVELVFQLEDSLLAGSDTTFADVAVQLDDGTWGILKHRRLDWGARTLTCTTSHFSSYSLTEGVQLEPSRALVFPGTPFALALHVTVCTRVPAPNGDPDLVTLIIACTTGNVSGFNFKNWSVNGVVGGNGTFGRVSPTTGQNVRYSSPAQEPNPNTVAVSVETTFEGMQALLVANITITGAEEWTGTATADFGSGETASSNVTWKYIGQYGTEKWFTAEGTVSYDIQSTTETCVSLSLTPNTGTIVATQSGLITIDYGVDPPNAYIVFATSWPAQYCYQCSGSDPSCTDVTLVPTWVIENWPVTDNTIWGFTSTGSADYTFNFTKSPPPPPPSPVIGAR